jgi:hypothetical protein
LASTKFCLASAGKEYLVYVPNGGAVTVDLSAAEGTCNVEWFDPQNGKTISAEAVQGGAGRELKAPFSGPAVLYLHAREKTKA